MALDFKYIDLYNKVRNVRMHGFKFLIHPDKLHEIGKPHITVLNLLGHGTQVLFKEALHNEINTCPWHSLRYGVKLQCIVRINWVAEIWVPHLQGIV